MCLRAKLVFPSLNVWFASRMDFARALTLWLACVHADRFEFVLCVTGACSLVGSCVV